MENFISCASRPTIEHRRSGGGTDYMRLRLVLFFFSILIQNILVQHYISIALCAYVCVGRRDGMKNDRQRKVFVSLAEELQNQTKRYLLG